MAGGRHRQRSALSPSRLAGRLSYANRERAVMGTLVAALVAGHLFIGTLTVQSLMSSDLRPDQTSLGTANPSTGSTKQGSSEAARGSAHK